MLVWPQKLEKVLFYKRNSTGKIRHTIFVLGEKERKNPQTNVACGVSGVLSLYRITFVNRDFASPPGYLGYLTVPKPCKSGFPVAAWVPRVFFSRRVSAVFRLLCCVAVSLTTCISAIY